MLDKGFLSPRQAEAVDAGAVAKLFASPIGSRMLAAKELRREFKFSLLWDAGELYGDARGEELLMQGVVDCFFEEEGRLVVVDYKTDLVRTREEALERAEMYRPQLETYREALRRICGKPVKECVLYFLVPGEAVSLKNE